jgi:hypothetical protein
MPSGNSAAAAVVLVSSAAPAVAVAVSAFAAAAAADACFSGRHNRVCQRAMLSVETGTSNAFVARLALCRS